MSQYFKLINYDKKERFCPSHATGAIKEWGFSRNFENSVAVIELLTHKWNGDSVSIVGDYSDSVYEDENYHDLTQEETLSLIEKNIDREFIRGGIFAELPEDDLVEPHYVGDDIYDDYFFVNFDAKQIIDFGKFPGQYSTFKDLINNSYTTGAYCALCYVLFEFNDWGYSWSKNRVGIIHKNSDFFARNNVHDITQDILEEIKNEGFYDDM